MIYYSALLDKCYITLFIIHFPEQSIGTFCSVSLSKPCFADCPPDRRAGFILPTSRDHSQ
jgi:hypothetical protein